MPVDEMCLWWLFITYSFQCDASIMTWSATSDVCTKEMCLRPTPTDQKFIPITVIPCSRLFITNAFNVRHMWWYGRSSATRVRKKYSFSPTPPNSKIFPTVVIPCLRPSNPLTPSSWYFPLSQGHDRINLVALKPFCRDILTSPGKLQSWTLDFSGALFENSRVSELHAT